MQVQKSKRRRVVTLEAGAFVAREIRKRCGRDPTHPVMISERLARLVPPHQGYGYDLIVHVGLARYLKHRQREEIRSELLAEQGLVISEGSITELCDRFLRLLERLHRQRTPALRAALNGSYPLHIDATSEHGKGGLFICLDGWRGWVLHAVKIASENADALRPCIEETIRRFGDPLAVVRDLSAAEAAAVDSLREKGIPDLICHYHFLGAIGKKLFDDPYAVLRNLLRQSQVRTQLRELLRALRQHTTAEVYTGTYGHGRLREDLFALFYWVLEGEGRKDLPYPFSLPLLATPSRYPISSSTNAAKRSRNVPNAGCPHPARMSSGACSSISPRSLPASTSYPAWPGRYPNWSAVGRPSASCAMSCASLMRNSPAGTCAISRSGSFRSWRSRDWVRSKRRPRPTTNSCENA